MMSLKNENISNKINAFKASISKFFEKFRSKSGEKKGFFKTLFLNIIKLPYLLISVLFSSGGGGGSAVKRSNKKHGTIKAKRGEESDLVYYFEDDGKEKKAPKGVDLSGPMESIANAVMSVSSVFVAILVPIFAYIKELSSLIAVFIKQVVDALSGLLTIITPLLWAAFFIVFLFYLGRGVLQYFFSGLLG